MRLGWIEIAYAWRSQHPFSITHVLPTKWLKIAWLEISCCFFLYRVSTSCISRLIQHKEPLNFVFPMFMLRCQTWKVAILMLPCSWFQPSTLNFEQIAMALFSVNCFFSFSLSFFWHAKVYGYNNNSYGPTFTIKIWLFIYFSFFSGNDIKTLSN